MMKITDFNMLFKWENLQNRQCIKYLFPPFTTTLCIRMVMCVMYCSLQHRTNNIISLLLDCVIKQLILCC